MSKPITCCHNCGSTWSPGSTEWEWQKCSSCGWERGQPVIDEDEDEDWNDMQDYFEGNNDDEV